MKRIWVTRTEPGASKLAAKLRKRGYQTVVEPIFRVDGIRTSKPQADVDLWIFVSTHAVVNAIANSWQPSNSVIAIGPATAKSLSEIGVEPQVPDQYSSEGVFVYIVRHLPTIQNVCIVAGRGGRNDLSEWLEQDGKHVYTWVVYERKPVNATLEVSNIDTVVVGSSAALSGVRDTLLKEREQDKLLNTTIIVPSPRVYRDACDMGFEKVFCSVSAADAAVVQLLDQLFGK